MSAYNNPGEMSALVNVLSSSHTQVVLEAPLATVISAMSLAQSSLACVHREVVCESVLKLDEEATFSKPIECGDFLGAMFVIIQAPAMVNMTQQKTSATGSIGATLNYRALVPSDADRPGETLNGSNVANYMLKENAADQVGITYSNGSSFATEQNITNDFAAYYPDYAPARLIKLARLIVNSSLVLYEATSDLIVLANELLCSTSSKYYQDLNHVEPSFSASARSDEAEIVRELKVRSLAPQTWIVKLPFSFAFSIQQAFPLTLLKAAHAATLESQEALATNVLTLEVTFNPLNSIICNGSNVGTSSTLTAANGAVSINTVTLNTDRNTNTSAFAANVNGNSLTTFRPERFKTSLVLTEMYVDAATLFAFQSRRNASTSGTSGTSGTGLQMFVTQLKALPSATAASSSVPLNIDLTSLDCPVTSLYWFYRLSRDEFRNIWYRMRGMNDQVTGRCVKGLTACELVIGDRTYTGKSSVLFDRIMPVEHAQQLPKYKDIYMYNFSVEPASAAWSAAAIPVGALNFNHVRGMSCFLQVWVDPAMFEDNTTTGGINAKSGYGGSPTVTVHAMAVATQVLTFTNQGVYLSSPESI